MALKRSTVEALCVLLAVSVGLSVGQAFSSPAGPSGLRANSSVGSGFIRNQGLDSNADFPRTDGGVSSSGGDSFLVSLGSGGISRSAPASGTGSASDNLGGSTSQDSNSGFAKSVFDANLGESSGFQESLTDSNIRLSGLAASSDQPEQRILNRAGSFASGFIPSTVLISAFTEDFLQEPVTITQETTVDVFKTIANIIYNSVPITLTEFIKTTEVAPTLQVISTAVDDRVFVATAPVTFTQTVTVTNTNTGYLYATEVSTDVYTVTHKAYDIRQKSVTSTLQQTQVFRPTIVRTRINTEYDTQTVEQTVFNTIVIQPRTSLTLVTSTIAFTQTPHSYQQFEGHGRHFAGQGQQLSGQGQQLSGQGQQLSFVRNPEGPQQSSDQLSRRNQQLLNLQLPERGDGDERNYRSYAL